jgi:hypothetical protein
LLDKLIPKKASNAFGRGEDTASLDAAKWKYSNTRTIV